MAIDTTQPRSRRALLAGAVGGLAAVAASAMGRAVPAAGADSDPLVIGAANEGSSQTKLTSSGGNHALRVEHTGAGGGISASAVGGTAVSGTSEDWYGLAGTSSNGNAVLAQAYAGTALAAVSHQGGYGIRVTKGRVRLHEVSGVAIIPAGATRTTVSPGFDINAQTFVLLTPMANIGGRALWFTKSASKDTFTVRMSPSRSRNTKIAWLALERG